MDLLIDDLRKKVLSLIELKSTAKEGFPIRIGSDIKKWIDHTFSYCFEASQRLDKKVFDIKKADEFYKKQ